MAETWIINDRPSKPTTFIQTTINYTSNNENYTSIEIDNLNIIYKTAETNNFVGEWDRFSFLWQDGAYQTITFNTAPTGELLTWLQANAVKQSSPITNLSEFLTDIADAIREKTGESGLINAQEFSEEIRNIPSGGGITQTNTIHFNVDGTEEAILGINNTLDGTPIKPTKTSYVFKGWSATSGGTSPITYPYTPLTTDITLYSIFLQEYKAKVTGLGSSSPSNVSFNVDSNFDWNFEEVVKDGDTFIKIPKMYRKVEATSNGQITSFTISNNKRDNDYLPYPCFVKEDGNEVDYILIGKYYNNSSSRMQSVQNTSPTSLAIGTARNLARARGDGYRLMDWQIFKLWQDLIICRKLTVNTNSGTAWTYDEFGIYWGTSGMWVDGIAGIDGNWVACDKPSSYINSPINSSQDYYQLSYTGPTSDGEVSKLGYDSTHPFVNLPNAVVSNTNYNTYYCDQYSYSSGNRPVGSRVGNGNADNGAFLCVAYNEWSDARGVRLCFQPQD